jgi:hypothetical protein
MLARSLLILFAAGNLMAAEADLTALRPPDLSKLSKQQFQELLSKGLTDQPELSGGRSRVQVREQNLCSIPLLKWKVNRPERFNMPQLPAGSKNIDRMATAPPAPECPDK